MIDVRISWLIFLALAAGSALLGHADAHQAAHQAATPFQQQQHQQQQQQHSRKLLQPAGAPQQFGYVSGSELDRAVAALLASATHQQPKPPPAAAAASDSVAAAAAAAPLQVRRCGTKEGSSADRAVAEQRFQIRLQQLGYSSQVLAAAAAAAAGSVTSRDSTGGSISVQPVTQIPVFFHIVQYNGSSGSSNSSSTLEGFIPRRRINQQIMLLNRAYRGSFRFLIQQVTWYTTEDKALFQSGQDSPGEMRIKDAVRQQQQQLNDSSSSSRIANSSAASSLHVYTWAPLNQVLGWATFPEGFYKNPSKDGVVVMHESVTGGSYKDYNLGHTLTHEVGHWLGAYHTFQGGCAMSATDGGDFVEDTPAVRSANTRCKKTDSCPSLPGEDLIENFMDYTPDACMTSFTAGQKERMLAQWAAYRAGS